MRGAPASPAVESLSGSRAKRSCGPYRAFTAPENFGFGLYNQNMKPSKKAKSSPSEAARREQAMLEALKRYKKRSAYISPEDALNPVVQIHYTSVWSPDVHASYPVFDHIQVTPKEIVEYMAFCLQKKVKPEDVTEARRLQFQVRKHVFYFDETIPQEQKSFYHSLKECHTIGVPYAPDGNTELREELYKILAQRAWDGEAYDIHFLQVLSAGQAPKPVPEAMLKALQALLRQQIEEQQQLLQQLKHFHPPIWVQAGESKQLLQPLEIALITSEPRHGLAVYTLEGAQYLSFATLGQLEEQLQGIPQFMRTSRQHLVNLSQIQTIQSAGRGRDLSLRNLPDTLTARVTAAYLPEFLRRMGQT